LNRQRRRTSLCLAEREILAFLGDWLYCSHFFQVDQIHLLSYCLNEEQTAIMKFTSAVVVSLAATGLSLFQTVAACVQEISLGVDPRDVAKANVKVDVYQCKSGNLANQPAQPLVVFAAGGGVPKDAYGSFAEGLSADGYIVAVIEHPVKFSPFAPAQNFVNAADFQNTIAYAEAQSASGLWNVDLTKIVLMGHSFGSGTILNALNQVCGFPFCQDPNVPFPSGVTVPLHPGVVLGVAYGASLNDRSGGFSSLKNVGGIPYGIINGAGDINYFLQLAGENLTQGTFNRLNPTKIIATINNLDHFSISEINTSPNRGDVLSTLPRAVQIAHVVDAMSYFLKQSLKNNPTQNFCNQIGGRTTNYTMAACLEQYR
jgi:hypothetical protein